MTTQRYALACRDQAGRQVIMRVTSTWLKNVRMGFAMLFAAIEYQTGLTK